MFVFRLLVPLAALIGLSALSPARALAQGDAAASVRAMRITADEIPVLDGRVDEEMWQRAPLIGPLTQVEPIPGGPVSHPTEVRIAYDSKFLYVSLVCFDDPSEVRGRQADRDANIQYDDVVEMWFDTFADERSAFWFQITPAGSRGDALLSDSGNRFNKDWDGIWRGRSGITGRGWEAELAFPFQTLAFNPDSSSWGFNLRRKRIASGEELRWASPSPAYRFFQLPEGGRITGLTGLEQGLGLDVTPFATTTFTSSDGDDDFTWRGDAGLDMSWRPNPSSTLRVTVNTDFAETEVDNRQINLTRFPLFFPEKRAFFLEDAGLFEFGAPSNSRSLVPFFSRNVGRDSDGQTLPILGGLKYTGRHGPLNVGVLNVAVDGENGVPERNLAVARATYDLGGESALGVMATDGNPGEGGGSSTLGLDARLGDSRFFGDRGSLSLWLWGLDTSSDDEGGDGSAFGFESQARSANWNASLEGSRIEEDFDPALGFVRRRGVESVLSDVGYTWRQGEEASWLRSYEAFVGVELQTDLIGSEDSWSVFASPVGIELLSEDAFSYSIEQERETLDNGFELGDGVQVPAGTFDMTTHQFSYEASGRRRFLGELEVEFGDFFGGDLRRFSINPILVPSKVFTLSAGFEDVEARLEGDRFHTQLFSANLDLTAGPDVSWKNLFQYDTESKQLGLQTRLRWILEPGRNLFLVGLFGFEKEDSLSSFQRTEQQLAIKLTYTVRF